MADTRIVPGRLTPGAGRHKDVPALTAPHMLTPEQYVLEATARIAAATHRVYFMTLTIADDDATGLLIDALVAAARRGVHVEVAADVFTYADAAGTFLPKSYRTRRHRDSSALAQRLTRAGARFTWLGRERGLIWRGRTHTKFCVIDDVAYSFGGVNLDRAGVGNVDFMFRVEDARLTDDLERVFRRVQHLNALESGHRSVALKYGKDRVLVDGGRPGDSLIYRRAMKWAAKAERVVLVSQDCPTGRLGRLVKERPHEIYFNPPANASLANHILIRCSMLASRTRSRYTRRDYLHAKFIVFYLRSGKRVAITGSHNFVKGGVVLGTREIALETTNAATIDQLEAFFRREVRVG